MIWDRQSRSAQQTEQFSCAESFGLFMEALRSLEFYAELSDSDRPDFAKLDEDLDEARVLLEKCYRDFPDDLLPRFYLAVTLTTVNERVYSQMVVDKLSGAEDRSNLLAVRAWPYLDQAIELLKDIIDCGDSELSQAIKFNLAQVYAKRENRGDLEKALELLHSIHDLPSVGEAPFVPVRKWEHLRWSEASDEDVAYHKYRIATASPSLARVWQRLRGKGSLRDEAEFRHFQEAVAFYYQTGTLRSMIKARIALTSKEVPRSNFLEAFDDLSKARVAIDKLKCLSAGQKHDLLADSWTKSGFLAYSHADQEGSERDKYLREAENCLNQVLLFKPNWIPAKTYLAMVHEAQGHAQKASLALKSALGKSAKEAPAAAKTPNADDIVAFILAMPLSTPAAEISMQVLRKFGPLALSTLVQVVSGLSLAKLETALIDKIRKWLEPSPQK